MQISKILDSRSVLFKGINNFYDDIRNLFGSVSLDKDSCPIHALNLLNKSINIIDEKNICDYQKAKKNQIEINQI